MSARGINLSKELLCMNAKADPTCLTTDAKPALDQLVLHGATKSCRAFKVDQPSFRKMLHSAPVHVLHQHANVS